MAEPFPSPSSAECDAFELRAMLYLDGDLDAVALRQFNEELSTHRVFRELFVDLCTLRGLLVEHQSSDRLGNLMTPSLQITPDETIMGEKVSAPEVSTEPSAGETAQSPALRSKRRRLNWKIAAGILLPLLIAPVILWRLMSAPAAILTAAVDAEWESPSGSLQPGSALPRGPISLKAGVAKITLNNGVSIVVQAPARFQVGTDNSATLDVGKLTAVVPQNAHGFAVHTSRATITDLGTEFGVEVSPDQITHAEVFKGQVQVALTLNAGQKTTAGTRLLGQSQAVDIAPNGDSMEIGTPSPLSFVRDQELAALPANGTLSPHDRWAAFSRQVALDPALVAYYTFDNESESPGQLLNRAQATLGTCDGTIENATWDEGRFPGKRALRFNGTNSRVNVNIPGSFERISLSTWVQLDQVNQQVIAMLDSDGWSSPGQLHWQMGLYGFWIGCYPDSGSLTCRPSGSLTGRWLHLVTTIDTTTGLGILYCNGAEAARATRSWPPLHIGAAGIGSWEPWTGSAESSRALLGRLDEMAIFNRVLSAREVKALYESGTTVEAN